MSQYWSSEIVFAWIPRPLSIFDYKTMSPKIAGKVAWFRYVRLWTNDLDKDMFYYEDIKG